MGIFDKAKERLERDNSGGWDRDYKKYIRKSPLDRIIELPLHDRCISLSYRRYQLPNHVRKNINYQLQLDEISDFSKRAVIPEHHPLSGIHKLAVIYNLDIGLMLEVSSVKDWENMNSQDRSFTLSYVPIAYHYRRFQSSYHVGGLSRDSVSPRIILFKESGIFEESPEFLKIGKNSIYLRSGISWPEKFYMQIQGMGINDLGFGSDWQDEAAYTG